jgi:methylated-DNA-[protein]-cysteine S-methyltransferase
MTYYTVVPSPVGRLLLAGSDDALERLHFLRGSKTAEPDPEWVENGKVFREATRQLESYFAGKLRDFRLELQPAGTPFQLAVWRELREIPYGHTISYGELARRIGQPGAARAVGLANGANPIAIIVPCHRVIGANGKLTGFGGGLEVKEKLLALERGERELAFR